MTSFPALTLWNCWGYMGSAIPDIMHHLFAQSMGRDGVHSVMMLAFKAFGQSLPPKGAEYFAKTLNDAGFLIDSAMVAVLGREFFAKPHGFYRKDDGTIYQRVQNKKTGLYENQVVKFNDWVAAESVTIHVKELEDGKKQYIPQIDVTFDENGMAQPKRAGLTPFQILWQYERVNAIALALFEVASVHSVLSTIVPCFVNIGKLRLSALHSIGSWVGIGRYLSLVKADACLVSAWDKLALVSVSIAYGCSALEHGKQWYADSKKWELPALITGGKCVSNAALGLFYGVMLITGREYSTLFAVGKVVSLISTVLDGTKKQWVADLRKASGIDTIEITNKQLQRMSTSGQQF